MEKYSTCEFDQSLFSSQFDYYNSGDPCNFDRYLLPQQESFNYSHSSELLNLYHNLFSQENDHMPQPDFIDFQAFNSCDSCSFLDIDLSSLYEECVIDTKHHLYLPSSENDLDYGENFEIFSNEGAIINLNHGTNYGEFIVSSPNENKYNPRGRSKSTLELHDIQKYFDVPISKAAKELKVSLTVLKKICRELNIKRWPHRKMKSLKSIIDSVKVSISIHQKHLFTITRMLLIIHLT